jgi:hypothetical protein
MNKTLLGLTRAHIDASRHAQRSRRRYWMVGTHPLIAGSSNGVDALVIADSGAFFSTVSRERAEKFKLN